ncbi:MAG: hypothetical protein NTZ59_11480 [Bacteroidetes bacterium]|nr:hypothetical protein [Bacteroidota bacterium]
MDNKSKRDAINAARVIKTAECVGVSTNLVQKVIRGERNNDKVLGVFMEIQEGENKLLEEVKKIVPFI